MEYLRRRHVLLAYLKPENIALDSLGHVSLCHPDIFGLEKRDRDRVVPGTPEIPAPELLLGQDASRAAYWRSLGILLFEMLTGILPSHHEDVEEQRRRIIDQTPQLPERLPTAARDIQTKLLDKDSARRLLGANGASEVKAHELFHDMDWLDLMQRRWEALFIKTDEAVPIFRVVSDTLVDSRRHYETEAQRVSDGVAEKEIVWDAYGQPNSGTRSKTKMTKSPQMRLFHRDSRMTGGNWYGSRRLNNFISTIASPAKKARSVQAVDTQTRHPRMNTLLLAARFPVKALSRTHSTLLRSWM